MCPILLGIPENILYYILWVTTEKRADQIFILWSPLKIKPTSLLVRLPAIWVSIVAVDPDDEDHDTD
ncbi:MAG TPA: hypothetical protein DCS29_01155 [Candidatus Magasanikbacteria bacterium]|nr:hypothetical protein [Candidatus Magasanikbacteria bacterium]